MIDLSYPELTFPRYRKSTEIFIPYDNTGSLGEEDVGWKRNLSGRRKGREKGERRGPSMGIWIPLMEKLCCRCECYKFKKDYICLYKILYCIVALVTSEA